MGKFRKKILPLFGGCFQGSGKFRKKILPLFRGGFLPIFEVALGVFASGSLLGGYAEFCETMPSRCFCVRFSPGGLR